MGADVFHTRGRGKNAQEAFDDAVDQACYDFGHQGYTGSIAEKSSFVKIPLPEGRNPYEYAETLISEGDSRIDSKWGPAGCFELGGEEFYFFGWASC